MVGLALAFIAYSCLHESLEGFFDRYGNPIVEDPDSPVDGIDGSQLLSALRRTIKMKGKRSKTTPRN